ncbi:hypothetical protein [Sphaerisporangium sp. TRM90804]|uniref:hypothetical protein n=1 Tax=Sphaerisporangium sp. TRM90804 TaxID=3031113 RepID=UPI00244963F0|nr:hypothetical protein [Sphaerisporangium sp. TRM90804]MDH2425963.1 hypothetical protein [Sphaerisporangium sp. TRM90804]
MRKTVEVIGFVMMLQGVSGAIDHLAAQPFFGIFLNFFHRQIVSRVDALAGYELYANLTLAVLGLAVASAGELFRPRS